MTRLCRDMNDRIQFYLGNRFHYALAVEYLDQGDEKLYMLSAIKSRFQEVSPFGPKKSFRMLYRRRVPPNLHHRKTSRLRFR